MLEKKAIKNIIKYMNPHSFLIDSNVLIYKINDDNFFVHLQSDLSTHLLSFIEDIYYTLDEDEDNFDEEICDIINNFESIQEDFECLEKHYVEIPPSEVYDTYVNLIIQCEENLDILKYNFLEYFKNNLTPNKYSILKNYINNNNNFMIFYDIMNTDFDIEEELEECINEGAYGAINEIINTDLEKLLSHDILEKHKTEIKKYYKSIGVDFTLSEEAERLEEEKKNKKLNIDLTNYLNNKN